MRHLRLCILLVLFGFTVSAVARITDNDLVFELDEPKDLTPSHQSAIDQDESSSGILSRAKRQFGDLFGSIFGTQSTTTAPSTTDASESLEMNGDFGNGDNYDDDNEFEGQEQNKDDTLINANQEEDIEKNNVNGDDEDYEVITDRSGSGESSSPHIQPGKELTIRISFIVNEPYKNEFSNRDSQPFRELSRALAEAVNNLYESQPGEQKATLVRIQSRPADEFTCKVTLDLQTINNYDTDNMQQVLRRHIRDTGRLGPYTVSDEEFSFKQFDEVFDRRLKCTETEIPCQSGECIDASKRCDGNTDCYDSSDEFGCTGIDEYEVSSEPITDPPYNPSTEPTYEVTTEAQPESTEPQRNSLMCQSYEQVRCANSEYYICDNQQCDGKVDCPNGDDEQNCSAKDENGNGRECPEDEMVCDVSRCVPLSKKCDRILDCQDGSDERNCPQQCQADDFRCKDGRCIEGFRKCDRVSDCREGEDEIGCACSPGEFRCGDGTCIEERRVCDGQINCIDQSDEDNCHSVPESDHTDQFMCDNGKYINKTLVCNRRYDCGFDDLSDEYQCPCKIGDFVCKVSGVCIDGKRQCDGSKDCNDLSDEQDCDPSQCKYYEMSCEVDKTCIDRSQRCDRMIDCSDGSDERGCIGNYCEFGHFECSDMSCIPAEKVCDYHRDCPDGKDEAKCPGSTDSHLVAERGRCGYTRFACESGECVPLEAGCDGKIDCLDGSDEKDCPEGHIDDCAFQCSDDTCLMESQRCDGRKDCPDGGDEQGCNSCGFRCNDGNCISEDQRCDSVADCPDDSDEKNCPVVSSSTHSPACNEKEFQCRTGQCIQSEFRCDGFPDCSDDGSDEENCPSVPEPDCGPDGLFCDGRCIEADAKCDGVRDCSNGQDEDHCIESCASNEYACPDGNCVDYRLVCDGRNDCNDGSDERECGCNQNEWQCLSGDCVPRSAQCDGIPNCRDGSDEASPPCSPSTLRPTTQSPFETTSYPYWNTSPPTQRPPYTPPPPVTHRPAWNQGPSGLAGLDLHTYPNEQIIRQNGDVVFQCRDEGPLRAQVQWIRPGNRPLPAGSIDNNGRLEIPRIQLADAGTYICHAVGYRNVPGSEASVQLEVEPYNPNTPSSLPSFACQPNQATCPNGDCISKSAICDGNFDCSDGSDESACSIRGVCEPNEFRCANRRCVSKAWVCDSDDDCKDGSDEANCAPAPPGAECHSTEFQCATSHQCIPKHFHCDGTSDCVDGSDEFGCSPVYISKPPIRMLRLQQHETMIITCVAVGVPTPVVSWRLNWGHIPNKCSMTSVNGVGTLTCPDVVESDQGAYSCEALNTKGFVFAVPDTILIVNDSSTPDICPPGYFNSEARSPSECISCFCFGATTTCKSADLFTYQLPTPLGQGGTRLVGVVQPERDVYQITEEPVSDIFEFNPTYNGATVTRIGPWSSRNIYPYIALPESYHGSQLKSYGGYIKYNVRPHNDYQQPSQYSPFPDILLKGGNNLLVHRASVGLRPNQPNDVSVRLFVGSWQKVTPSGLRPASREDIMMTLAQVDGILLRGEESGGSIDISDFKMDSAGTDNTGLGSAAYVEECSCPRGYNGLSCQSCTQGFSRVSSGRWLGQCVAEEPQICQPGYYGDPSRGIPCKVCPCPLTNPGNQFSRTCRLESDGQVTCNCPTGYDGRRCERCSQGYVGNPTIPGDRCRPYIQPTPPAPAPYCDSRGTENEVDGVCNCKHYAEGEKCDRCVSDTFHLSSDNNYGCAECFCMGVTTSCASSSLRRSTVSTRFAHRSAVSDVRLVDWPTPQGSEPHFITRGLYTDASTQELSFSQFDRQNPITYYWALPSNRFAGDKITAYGGFLNYTIRHVPAPGGQSSKNNAPDVLLVSSNDIRLLHYDGATPNTDGYLSNSVQLMEQFWQKSDGDAAHRQDILIALADLEAILVKATYTTSTNLASLVSAGLDTADDRGTGPRALHVEQCRCPPGYLGTSCEDCAPGYTRAESGLYLGFCEPCECNGHSEECHPESGECMNCRNNTFGKNCEECGPGYVFDDYHNCVPSINSSNIAKCRCDPRGTVPPVCVDYQVSCNCKANVGGSTCNQCVPGTFLLDSSNPLGCSECFCSGVTDQCHEANHLYRQQIPSAIIDRSHGFKLSTYDLSTVIEEDLVLNVHLNQIGHVFNRYDPTPLYWSLPESFTGDRVTSYGGNLTLTQKYETDDNQNYPIPDKDVVLIGKDLTIFWTNPRTLHSGIQNVYTVPLHENQDWRTSEYGAAPRPVSRKDMLMVLTDIQNILVRATVSENIKETYLSDVSMDTALPRNGAGQPIARNIELCKCPLGYEGTSCERCQAGHYSDASGRCLQCPCGERADSCGVDNMGNVVCNCNPPFSGPDCSIDETMIVTNPPIPPSPPQPSILVTVSAPTIQIKEVGSTVRFRCAARSQYTNSPIKVTWTRQGGVLPPSRTIIEDSTGELIIRDVKESDSGTYLCQASDGYSTGYDRATLTVPGNYETTPRATINTPSLEVYEGDPFELRCEATGNPAPTLTWLRSNRRALGIGHSSVNGIYRVDEAQRSDEGEYRCIASNPNGQDQKLSVVYVLPKPNGGQSQRLMVNPPNPVVREGESLTIVCSADQAVPPNLISWSRVDGYLPDNFRSYNGQLRASTVRPEDAGIYRCSADGNVVPITVVLTVHRNVPSPPQPTEPVSVVVDLESTTIPEGHNLTVKCRPQGEPLPIIKWTKIGSEFSPEVSQQGNNLVIGRARISDRGMYVCVGTSASGLTVQAATAIEVEHRERPIVEIWPFGTQQVIIGGEALLQCRVTAGAPEPVITWSRPSGRSLTPNTHLMPGGVLSLSSVTENEEGVYTCTGSNNAGEGSASATIVVSSPPVVVIRPDTYMSVEPGSPVNVDCRASGYPEPTAYWTMVSPQERVMGTKTPGGAVLRFSRVEEADEGTYSCIAQNSAGTVEEKVHITVADNEIDSVPTRGDTPGQDDGASGEIVIHPPANQSYTAIEGEDGVLRCEVPSQFNKFRISWVRPEGYPLPRGNEKRQDWLKLTNVTTNDAGIYECRVRDASNGAVIYTVQIPLTVLKPPRIVLLPPTQTVRPGDTAHLQCNATGDPPLDVQWYPERGSFPDRVEVRSSSPASKSLVFHGIEVVDQGRYVCKATNNAGEAEAIAEVIVNTTVSTVQSSSERSQTAVVGSNVQLACTPGGIGSEVSWSRQVGQLPARIRSLQGGASLLLEKVNQSDSGRYICVVRTLDGRTNRVYIDLQIIGTDRNLLVITSPRDGPVNEGESLQIDCRSSGEPLQVNWVVQPQTRRHLDSRPYQNGALLNFDRVLLQDSGIYRCEGRDVYGTQFHKEFTLNVIPYSALSDAPPRGNDVDISFPDIVKSAPLGSNIELSCDHDLDGPTTYQWTRPNSELPAKVDTRMSKLRLLKLSEHDAGSYICKVSNGRVSMQRKVVLRVTNIVPRFKRDGFLALEKLNDAYMSVDVEVSLKPEDYDGIILYNSEKEDPSGDFISLSLIGGVPEYRYNLGAGTTVIRGDRPLDLHQWHTIKISRSKKDGFMYIDGIGPFNGTAEGTYQGLDLGADLYVGGVPDTNQLPEDFRPKSGLVGCIGRLTLGRLDMSLMRDAKETNRLDQCDSCTPNPCYNNAVCQDALTARGYTCLCPEGFSGTDCKRAGEACRPGICGKGKCRDTDDGLQCSCPLGFVGKRCETWVEIEYPAFDGGAYIAYGPPKPVRHLKMSLRVKPVAPVRDGIIFYCAESRHGHGDFTSLTTKDGHLEFRFDTGSGPAIIKSSRPVVTNEWTNVSVSRFYNQGKLTLNGNETISGTAPGTKKVLNLETPLYVGGYNSDWLTVNKAVGVQSGFIGCISDVEIHGAKLDIVSSPIQSNNVQECGYPQQLIDLRPYGGHRGDIPSNGAQDDMCPQCENGGYCQSGSVSCTCPPAYAGRRCEKPASRLTPQSINACDAQPCQNGGTCRNTPPSTVAGLYRCDCPLSTGGFNCQLRVELVDDVTLNGEGFIELPASLLPHDNPNEYETIAMAFTTDIPDGLLLYQGETGLDARNGDFLIIQVSGGFVELQWELGGGVGTIRVSDIPVSDGSRHQVVVRRKGSDAYLEVDDHQEQGRAPGLSQMFNADSSIFIGGAPVSMNAAGFNGFSGCIHQVELQDSRAINLGRMAISAQNAVPCTNLETNDLRRNY